MGTIGAVEWLEGSQNANLSSADFGSNFSVIALFYVSCMWFP